MISTGTKQCTIIRFARYPSATAKAWFSQWCVFMQILVCAVYIYTHLYLYDAYIDGGIIQHWHLQFTGVQISTGLKIQNPKSKISKTTKFFARFRRCDLCFEFLVFWISESVALWIPGHQEVHFRVSWGGGGEHMYMCMYMCICICIHMYMYINLCIYRNGGQEKKRCTLQAWVVWSMVLQRTHRLYRNWQGFD